MSAATCTPSQSSAPPRESKKSTHLAGERQERLVKPLLLGVPDVGRDDLLERELVLVALQLLAELFCLDRELAADGVLNLENGRVEVFGREGAHVVGGAERGWNCPGQAGELM